MQPAPNPLMNLAPIVAIFVIFYFLLIRPQQKQQKEHERMLKDLKTGDKILTAGGLYGT
ncbi:MAG: preprotein translocase subunit YajC, partial [Elusimicrobia bacterium]|nr:preprotein translocase subunit YajC [Elusimicrobiota bacterium]